MIARLPGGRPLKPRPVPRLSPDVYRAAFLARRCECGSPDCLAPVWAKRFGGAA